MPEYFHSIDHVRDIVRHLVAQNPLFEFLTAGCLPLVLPAPPSAAERLRLIIVKIDVRVAVARVE